MAEVEPYIKEHMEMLRQENPHRGKAWLARAHMSRSTSGLEIDLAVQALAQMKSFKS